jgi:hypothetical protein
LGTQINLKPDEIQATDSPAQLGLKDEQFKSILAELQKSPPKSHLDTANKWVDLITKAIIGAVVAVVTTYTGCREYKARRVEFQAKSFAGLFAEKEEARIGAAATVVNDLDKDQLKEFVRLTLDRFSDKPPVRDYAEQGVINMANTCYDKTSKIPLIMDVMAEGLGKERDDATKERAADVVDRIGWPNANWINAAIPLLNNGTEQLDIRIKVCTAIGDLHWDDASGSDLAPHISSLRKTLADILQTSQSSDDIHIACKSALQGLPRQQQR